MNIPRYWSKATAVETDPHGKQLNFTCWRGSHRSLEEARQLAVEAARRICQRLLQGEAIDRYAYSEAPLREEILQEFAEDDGGARALLTRNAYGATVLNTARIMFVDVDFPPPTLGQAFAALWRLLLRRPSPMEERQAQTLKQIENFLISRPEFGIRAYRTRAGIRLMATHAPFAPDDSATLQLLESLGADPLYVKLCRAQQCFRARLTPKPWRCRTPKMPVRYPREDREQEQRFTQWRTDYETACRRYAACRYLGALGNETIHPAAEQIIALHDDLSRAYENLALA